MTIHVSVYRNFAIARAYPHGIAFASSGRVPCTEAEAINEVVVEMERFGVKVDRELVDVKRTDWRKSGAA